LSSVLIQPFSTTSLLAFPEKSDFTVTDFYANIANRRPVKQLDRDIVVVDINRSGREEIAEALEILSLCDVKAVALDVNFEEATKDDTKLLAALQNCPRLILPLVVQPDDKGKFEICRRPFFFNTIKGIIYGAANLPQKQEGGTIREFPVIFSLAGATLPSFAAATAAAAAPEMQKILKQRGNMHEIIDFTSREFNIIGIEELEERADEVVSKTVIMGDCNASDDMHATPVNSSMAGVMIHAYSVATVVNGSWYEYSGKAIDWLVAFILCFLIVLTSFSIKNGMRGLVVRCLQVVMVYAAMHIGYRLYVDGHFVVNFSYSLLMIAFGIFSIDVWNGLTVILNRSIAKIKHRKIKRITA